MADAQAASQVILIRPTGFDHDPQTAATNAFQRRLNDPQVRKLAGEEFDGLLEALRNCGVGFTVLDPADPQAPNAVFPNNWFSTHADGALVIYPMFTASRRVERDPGLATHLRNEAYAVEVIFDLSPLEQKDQFLEGTGSLVLDRRARLAFACISARTTEQALSAWCNQMTFTAIPFTATMDGKLTGDPVYHTNVVMSIGEAFAAVCLDAIPYPAERQEVEEELKKAGKEIIPLSVGQMHAYVGNMLQLKGVALEPGGDNKFIFLSETAFLALSPTQRTALHRHGQLVPVPIPTIETVGGGSIRCMIAENFLPLRS